MILHVATPELNTFLDATKPLWRRPHVGAAVFIGTEDPSAFSLVTSLARVDHISATSPSPSPNAGPFSPTALMKLPVRNGQPIERFELSKEDYGAISPHEWVAPDYRSKPSILALPCSALASIKSLVKPTLRSSHAPDPPISLHPAQGRVYSVSNSLALLRYFTPLRSTTDNTELTMPLSVAETLASIAEAYDATGLFDPNGHITILAYESHFIVTPASSLIETPNVSVTILRAAPIAFSYRDFIQPLETTPWSCPSSPCSDTPSICSITLNKPSLSEVTEYLADNKHCFDSKTLRTIRLSFDHRSLPTLDLGPGGPAAIRLPAEKAIPTRLPFSVHFAADRFVDALRFCLSSVKRVDFIPRSAHQPALFVDNHRALALLAPCVPPSN